MSSSANCADNLFKISSSSSFPSDHQNPNPNSAQDYYNPPFLFGDNYSPSPFFDELHDSPLNQIFLFQNHQLIMSANHHHQLSVAAVDHHQNNITNTDHDPTIKKPASSAKCNTSTNNAVDASSLKLDVKEANRLSKRARNLGAIPRRRTGKKDRHSKICTAQGIRDRRMRLSLQVARKFFDLQDTLGYDKASHTIEWLFNQSKEAIKELAEDRDPEAKISEELSNFISDECEDVVSGIIEANNYSNNNNDVYKESRTIVQSPPNSMPFCVGKDERDPPQQVPQCKPNYTRESRDKARARARRRTLEKTMIKRSKSNPSDDDDHLRKLGFQNSPDFEEVVDDDQESKYNNNYSFGGVCDSVVDLHQQQLGDLGTIEKLLMMGNSSSSMSSLRRPTSVCQDLCSAVVPAGLYNVDQQSGTLMGFFGNWNMLQNNVDRTNPIDYGLLTNQDSLAGNPNPSIYSATPKFP